MSSKIRKISIGSANFGQKYTFNKIELNQKEVSRILDFAKKNRIYCIDTAEAYKKSEIKIGNYIRNQSFKDWIITTKLSKSKRDLLKIFKKSEKNLSIKPLNLLAHNSESFFDNNFRKELIRIKKNENINIGVSIYNEKELIKVLDTFEPDIVQIPINILDKKFYTNDLIKNLKKNNIKIQARSIFFQGIFFKNSRYIKKNFPSIYKNFEILKNIAKKNNLAISELALRFVAKIHEIDKFILGINSVEELKLNIKVINKEISKKIFDEIIDTKNIEIDTLSILSSNINRRLIK